jgi:hypothetical protein
VGVTVIGSKHPNPENIPHSMQKQSMQKNPSLMPSLQNGQVVHGSPVKESSILQRETSIHDVDKPTEDVKEISKEPVAKAGATGSG